jgi:IS1 family transposase/transposase-like protein
VTCHCCSGDCKKLGFYKNRNRRVQRYYCKRCAKSYSEDQPLDNLRVDHAKAAQIIRCLCDGVGIRSTARIVGCHRDTVLAVLETVGPKCESFLNQKLQGLAVSSLQIDELWAKVGCRQFRTTLDDPENGDFYSFIGMDAATKLIVHHYTGKRTVESTNEFVSVLGQRVLGRPQVTSDGWFAYPQALRRSFNNRLDYGILTKVYASDPKMLKDMKRRYSPPEVKSINITVEVGNPKPHKISTSYIERLNLSIRTQNRRFTRLCMGYSRKLANHKYSLSLFVCYHNWCKKHASLGTSPAVAHKLADHVWTIEELIGGMSLA